MKKLTFLMILLTLTRSSLAMTIPLTAPIIVMDNVGNIATITDSKTFAEAKKLSGALTAAGQHLIFKKTGLYKKEDSKEEYSIILPLTKQQIQLLFAISTHKNDIEKAIALRKIPFKNITRSDINTLQLPNELQRYFDNLVILETKDNLLMPVHKDAFRFFFDIGDLQDFDNELIVRIGLIRKFEIALLYSVIKNIPPFLIQSESEHNLIQRIKQKVTLLLQHISNAYDKELQMEKPKTSPGNRKKLVETKINTILLNMLNAANFLEAKSFILTGLYELYIDHLNNSVDLQKKLQEYPFLQDIAYKYPSIESLLNKGEYRFYRIESVQHGNDNFLQIVITGDIYSLTGLSHISGIKNCKQLIVEKTTLVSLRKGDFYSLSNIETLVIRNNPNLSTLQPHCLEGLSNLKTLIFEKNNIKVLAHSNVFNLNKLNHLGFKSNHLTTIQANWAYLPNLERLDIIEPDLTVLETGWLNNLKSLKRLFVHTKVKTSAIEEEIDRKYKSWISSKPNVTSVLDLTYFLGK